MPRIDDGEYFRQRAQQERAIAAAALDEGVAKAHLQMAEEYERKAAEHEAAKADKPSES
ncbi:hypothetical protein IAG41_09115 [Sphingomonas sp. JC676]|uniref:hypothetical protein n=1 Tax=Sphingomonas sp. JC676 TaxID=2768065 RepID=UPI0016584E35|nr:hypothetical protein [Sphingomonas sp. JC676]MBC9032550.1 hypothetical protein [Sphingomonas sp. JC676]